MPTSSDDILDLFDEAWERLRNRMTGLTDDEWQWQPTRDDRISLRWRLHHIAEFLREDRNSAWLGLPPEAVTDTTPTDAATALAEVDAAYARWRGQLAGVGEESLAQPIGPVAGPYAESTRRSFALHIADELIHHGAEAALLRDLHAAKN